MGRKPGDRLPPISHSVALVIAAWAVIFEISRLVREVASQPGNNDYRVFYLAAKAGVTWGWPHIYDPFLLQQLSTTTASAGAPDISPLYTYLNPPMLAWLLAAMTPLPFLVGFCIWAAVNAATLGAACRLVFSRSRMVWAAVFLGSIAVWPTAFALERGQPELLLFAVVIGSWWCADRGHNRTAGILLGLATFLKPQDIVLLPAVFLICRLGGATLWWLATTAAAAAISVAVLGPVGTGTYLGVTLWAASDPNFSASPLFSPFGAHTSLLIGQAVLAAAALAGVWLNRRSLRVAVAIGIAGTLVSSLHLHEYDRVGLVVAAWLAMDRFRSPVGMAWLVAGLVCIQLPAIGIRTPILVWQPLWLVWLAVPTYRLEIFQRVLQPPAPLERVTAAP
jgi:hypothetical protein